MDKRLPKIFDYSDSDFPSLNPSTRRKNTAASKPRKISPESEPVPKTEISSSCKSERNSSSKVLKPNEHKETYSIDINEAVKKTSNQSITRTRPTSIRRDEYLSGNPLDADNPMRLKGKFGVPKKPKRISKTKKNVLQVREQVSKAKTFAKNVVIENECIRYDSKLSGEDIQNVIHLAKSAEIRKRLQCLIEKFEDTKEERDDQVDQAEPTEDFYHDTTNTVEFRNLVELLRVPTHLMVIHDHKFKMYCDNCITETLNEASATLVFQIARLQLNKYLKCPMKAVANKRYVLGLKQTIKYTRMNRTKLIICVPDMEDGMYDLVDELKSLASAYGIPYLFGLSRRRLGSLTYKKVGVCCFGLLDYSSAEDNFRLVNEEASIAKRMYLAKCLSAKERCERFLPLDSLVSGPSSQSKAESDTNVTQGLASQIQQKLVFTAADDDMKDETGL